MTVFAAQELPEWVNPVSIVIGIAVLVVLGLALVVFANYARLWVQSFSTGAGIGIFDLLGMTFRKVRSDVIVRSKIMAVQAGLTEREFGVTSKALEGHYLAGGTSRW